MVTFWLINDTSGLLKSIASLYHFENNFHCFNENIEECIDSYNGHFITCFKRKDIFRIFEYNSTFE